MLCNTMDFIGAEHERARAPTDGVPDDGAGMVHLADLEGAPPGRPAMVLQHMCVYTYIYIYTHTPYC